MKTAKGKFTLASWNEETYADIGDGAKLTRAAVTQTFEGDVEGNGAVEWLMSYRTDGTARFVGLQRVDGRVGDREGTFVLEAAGDFDGKMAKWDAVIIPGTATGDLQGITGHGKFGAPHGPEATFVLDYQLD